MQKSSAGKSSGGIGVFSDGATTVGIKIRFPLRISCIHRIEQSARNRASLHGRISCMESGTTMGLVDKKDEYHESSSKSPVISLVSIVRMRLLLSRCYTMAYLLADSILLHAFHLISMSGTASKRLISSSWPSVAAKSPCRCAIYEIGQPRGQNQIFQ